MGESKRRRKKDPNHGKGFGKEKTCLLFTYIGEKLAKEIMKDFVLDIILVDIPLSGNKVAVFYRDPNWEFLDIEIFADRLNKQELPLDCSHERLKKVYGMVQGELLMERLKAGVIKGRIVEERGEKILKFENF